MTARRPRLTALLVLLLLVCARPAFADLTVFLGSNRTPANRAVRGAAASLSLLVLGFEVEYSDTAADEAAGAPALRSGMFNLLVQTPFPVAGLQFYGTVGGGLYREELAGHQETNIGTNAGGGVKVSLVGPFRLRIDYRVFVLRQARVDRPQRLYVGLGLGF